MNRNKFIVIIVLSVCLISASARAADSFIIVSDLDDTVKITDVSNRDNMTCNAVASKLVFAGMPQLYRFLLGENSPADRLMFLSGTPFILSHKVRELLNDAHFPAYRLTLRGLTDLFSPAFEYKTKHMEELYGAPEGNNFILIGDDTENDPEAYANFSTTQKQNNVRAIYIHKIDGTKWQDWKGRPVRSFFFVTAYDIAMREFVAGHLSENQALEVGNTVYKSDNVTFLPDFQWCSIDSNDYEQIADLTENLKELKKQIDKRMTNRCAQRTKASQSQ